jgi:hypothetical protein
MNKEDVILMAREADLNVHDPAIDLLQRFAALVAAAEREACAKVCDDWPNGRDDVYSIGVAIRARGEK